MALNTEPCPEARDGHSDAGRDGYRPRIGPESRAYLATFLEDFEIEIIPFGEVHWRRAVEAFRRYGKGRHPAGLNFGDCMTYATAVVADQPLLYMGDHFALTPTGAEGTPGVRG